MPHRTQDSSVALDKSLGFSDPDKLGSSGSFRFKPAVVQLLRDMRNCGLLVQRGNVLDSQWFLGGGWRQGTLGDQRGHATSAPKIGQHPQQACDAERKIIAHSPLARTIEAEGRSELQDPCLK